MVLPPLFRPVPLYSLLLSSAKHLDGQEQGHQKGGNPVMSALFPCPAETSMAFLVFLYVTLCLASYPHAQ